MNPERIATWNFRQAGQLDAEQQASLDNFLAQLAASLTAALTAHLRTPVPVSAAGANRLVFRAWFEQAQAAGPSYVAAIQVGTQSAVLAIDAGLALAIIDVALGGPGEPLAPPREPTAIEERMLEAVGAEAASAIEAEWPAEMGHHFKFAGRRPWAAAAALQQADEKSLVLGFAVQCGKTTGQMAWVLPANLGVALVRRLLQPVAQRAPSAGDARALQQQRMARAAFPLQLVLPPIKVEMGQLLEMRAGHVLELGFSTNGTAQLLVAGRVWGEAQPVRHDNKRAGLIQSIHPRPAPLAEAD